MDGKKVLQSPRLVVDFKGMIPPPAPRTAGCDLVAPKTNLVGYSMSFKN